LWCGEGKAASALHGSIRIRALQIDTQTRDRVIDPNVVFRQFRGRPGRARFERLTNDVLRAGSLELGGRGRVVVLKSAKHTVCNTNLSQQRRAIG
jgi:hypothetical protein